MDPMGFKSIVNHLRVLIVIVMLAIFSGLYVSFSVSNAVVRVSDAVSETAHVVAGTNETVRASHKLITQFLEQTKQPLVRGSENSDIIRENSAELTRAMQTALQKMEALEQRADRMEQSVQVSQQQLNELLTLVHDPFRSVLNRFRSREE